MMDAKFFATATGRSDAREFLDGLAVRNRMQILADIQAFRLYGASAPISMKPIRGHRPMYEIRTGGFRTFYVVHEGVMWILHVCRKDAQQRGIRVAAKRMTQVRGG